MTLMTELKVISTHTVVIGIVDGRDLPKDNLGMMLFHLADELNECREVIAWVYDQLAEARVCFEPDLTGNHIFIKVIFGDHAEATSFKLRWQS